MLPCSFFNDRVWWSLCTRDNVTRWLRYFKDGEFSGLGCYEAQRVGSREVVEAEIYSARAAEPRCLIPLSHDPHAFGP
jgi:hypothetical protein